MLLQQAQEQRRNGIAIAIRTFKSPEDEIEN
jgi:hypothetical protein